MLKDISWTPDDLSEALGQTFQGKWIARRIISDSRKVESGDLFIALKGPNHDGHDHVVDALTKGAAAAIVEKQVTGVDADKLVIVRDVMTALNQLGHFARTRSTAKVIAVTGSFGKTSTKEMIGHVLSRQGPSTVTERSLNNHWGVPLSLTQLGKQDAYGVFEMGMNHKGEISALTKLAEPHVALITTIAAAHMEHFKNEEEIAYAKAEILEGVVKGGTAIFNKDNQYFDLLKTVASKQGVKHILSFGSSKDCDACLNGVKTAADGIIIDATFKGKPLKIEMPVYGEHWALNTLGALLAVSAIGGDVAKAVDDLKDMQPVSGRGVHHLKEIKGGMLRIIDESYNAGPASMEAAIKVLASIPVKGRRIAVLGDMLEVGPTEKQVHEHLAEILVAGKIDLVFTSGDKMKWLHDVLPAKMKAKHNNDPVKLANDVITAVAAGDAVMIKGSRGAYQEKGRMYPVVEALLKA